MNLSKEQITLFCEKWQEVFNYFLPDGRSLEKDVQFYLYHLPDNINFDLLIKACDYAILNKNFYPKLAEIFDYMDLIREIEITSNYKRQEQEAREREERELQEHKARMAALSEEEKEKLKAETRRLMKELQDSLSAGLKKKVLDVTVKTDKDC
jgi:signal transduction histidine kinase